MHKRLKGNLFCPYIQEGRKMKKATLTLLCLFLSIPCYARTITINADGTGDYPTIQTAIDDTNDGDVIILEPGTYTGDGNRDIDYLGKAITVRSTDPNDPNIVATTVIDCNGTETEPYGGFWFRSNESLDSELAGLTITRCYLKWHRGGAAIYCYHSSPTIRNCTITENTSGPNLVGSWSIYGGGIVLYRSNAVITNCTVTGNLINCEGWISGGGISCYRGSPTISNCIITDNRTVGAGLPLGTVAGGISCVQSNLTITNCIISGNSADFGGGILCSGGNVIISNCLITDNSADSGSGLWCSDSTATISNCTITSNSGQISAWGGEAIFCGDTDTITNCIIWNNTPREISGSGCDVSYSNIKGGWLGTGNIDTDPCFVDPVNRDYRLNPDSPCLDAGTNEVPGGLPPGDLDGRTRILDSDNDNVPIVEMGAYELSPIEIPFIRAKPHQFIFWTFKSSPNPPSQTLSIRNIGKGSLKWRISEDCDWLDVWPVRGKTSAETDQITLQVDTSVGGLGQVNNCRLTIQSEDSNNSPLTIPVKLCLFDDDSLIVPTHFPTIQAAVDAALEGRKVIVLPGRYTGEGNRDIDYLGKAITVRSIDPEDPQIVAATLIDCNSSQDDSHRGFYFHSGEDANSVLDGITVTRGGQSGLRGGGINCEDSSPTIKRCNLRANDGSAFYNVGGSPEIIGCVFTANRGHPHPGGGGGMHNDGGSPTLTDCTITENYGSYGGGIYCDRGQAILSNCTIAQNRASDGGGIFCDFESAVTITNCRIAKNTAWYNGGGIFCHWHSTVTIANCIITENTALWTGGGIDAGHSDNNLSIANCVLSKNSARTGGGLYGGGGTIINCAITGNSATVHPSGFSGSGGGIYEWNGSISNCLITGNSAADEAGGLGDCSGPVTNCTIVGNKARYDGGIYDWGGDLALTNCIIWNNWAVEDPQLSSCIQPAYSCIQNQTGGVGNIAADPCFVEPGYWVDVNDPNIIVEPNDPNAFWLDGDYHLSAGSPCINTGDPCYPQGPNETDLDGNPRIIDGRIDMGAYEYLQPLESRLWILPRTISRKSRQKNIMAWLRLPAGITRDDIDPNVPLTLYPGDIEASRQFIFQNDRYNNPGTFILAFFKKSDLMDAVPDNGQVQLEVVGQLNTSRYFFGRRTIRIINPPHRRGRSPNRH